MTKTRTEDAQTEDVAEVDVDVDVEDGTPAIEFLSNGRIRVNDDDVHYLLRMPRFGEFRRIKDAVFAATTVINEHMPDQKKLDPKNPEQVAAFVTASEVLVEISYAEIAKVMLYIFNGDDEHRGLSNTKLTEDPDDWPTWMVAERSIMQQMLQHWRTVPLGRG